jgi:hypothetical protein
MRGAYIVRGTERTAIQSLGDVLRDSLLTGDSVMDPAIMTEKDKPFCKWIGFGLGKGLTSSSRNVSIYGVPESVNGSGWHAELVKGIDGVDPSPLCYRSDHILGFGDFVRWVYFANPAGTGDFLGIDFGLPERPTAGVAETMFRVNQTVQVCARHGMPLATQVVLLHPRMFESPSLTELRLSLKLSAVGDWLSRGDGLFDLRNGTRCPACGLDTRGDHFNFCYRCGFKFI